MDSDDWRLIIMLTAGVTLLIRYFQRQRSLVELLIAQGFLPGVTADFAEPDRFEELIASTRSKAFPEGVPSR
jgi:hypothetical protein